MKITTLFTSFALVLFFLACNTDPEPTDAMTELENTFYQNYDKASGEALIAAYEKQLDTMSDDATAKVAVLGKSAVVYFKMGSNTGLQEDFARILQEYPEAANTPATTQRVLDTLLYNITDPKTLRLIPSVAREYLTLTEIYAKARPDDPKSPEKLYKAGEIARSIGAFQEALNIYATIENYFPQYEKAPKALFMQAFTYAEDLNDEAKARELYEAFIAKYPEDDFVDDAQMLLETLGKSDEEIFQQLEGKKG